MSALLASIGTTHPWNIAGIGLDARVATEYGLPQVCAVAAVSAQDATGVHLVESLACRVLRAQLDSFPAGVTAVRVGALGSAENVREVGRFLRAHAQIPAVVDPVFDATLGGRLGDDDVRDAFRDELLDISSVVLTPNLDEAAVLLAPHVPADAASSARALRDRGSRAVLLKGGHGNGDPTDTFADASGERAYTEPRLPGSMRGGGCTLAAALACELAQGRDLLGAVQSARAFVRERIAANVHFGGLHVAFGA
ncbi:MAG: hydroxymethylpyrimidine/phosphomethylpyrimidine kinase [Candidatus Eremiobacteraeota bacterium]|nr:hydroxymethylpyrimidine/phosphomethylpyrimidine kinase [Candidatus Eremiobacteraeota bacterium]